MTASTDFCPVCGAVNDAVHTHCFACGYPFTAEKKSIPGDEVVWHGRYHLGGFLGSGGFSMVYRARDRQEGEREVAIKKISLQGLSAEEMIEATNTFHRELSMLSTLMHPQIPRLYDHFDDQDHRYLVLEYLEGQTLEALLATRKASRKPLRIDEILAIASQLCTVLEYLHSRQPPIVFRDLKPGNILLTSDGKLYLIDFGIARRYQPGQPQDTQRLGSPGYAAPEQYGRAQTTPQADIYSLGALLRFLLSGQDPTDGSFILPPLRLSSQQGLATLEMLVAQMLSPSPGERPAGVRAVAEILSGHTSQVNAVAWSPDGTRIVSGSGRTVGSSGDNTVQTWNANDGGNALTYRGLAAAVNAVVWSPDGHRIAAAPDGQRVTPSPNDTTVQVWDATTGETILTYRGHINTATAVAWSPDGQRIVSAGNDTVDQMQVWNAADGQERLVYHYPPTRGVIWGVEAVAWSPDGRRIASASNNNAVQIWNAP